MTTSNSTTNTMTTIEADEHVPMIHIYREFAATAAQLFRAHTEPELFLRWVGPADMSTEIDYWDARDGGSWRYTSTRGADRTAFRGCFHTVSHDRIVQTFTWEGMPEAVALETLTFEETGQGRTRLHATSLCDSFQARDAWLASGMETGVEDGYAQIDRMLTDGAL